MSLECVAASKITLLFVFYQIGFALAGAAFFPLPDKWGRKKTLIRFFAIHLAAQFLIIFCPNYWVRCLGFFLMGASQIKNSTSYVMLFDLI